ncbi:MAG TPA: methionyl-tRNA formyltransferase [Burkholderiales bacterium]|nr:methionyl-tRNA formyltransferase [Burkholderiales bacterium]
MRIVFAGTPAFAAHALQALIEGGHEIALVLTRPDRPAGRGLKLAVGEVKQLAEQARLPLLQPQTLKDAQLHLHLHAAGADAMVVAAYGLILPPALLDLFPAGCINIHASLLPRWRGAAPIQRAILAGDEETGVAIMRMEAGLDSGPVYQKRRIPIAGDDTAGTLHDKLAALGARCIVEALPAIADGTLEGVPQDEDGATYAPKIAKHEAAIDWRRNAVEVDRQLRAFNPFPGAYSTLRGELLKVWSATVAAALPAPPGTILRADEQGIVVACGNGALCATELQRAGGKRLAAAEFVHGLALAPGERFGA